MTDSTPTGGSARDALARMHIQMTKEDEERSLATQRRLAELAKAGKIVIMDEFVALTNQAADEISKMNFGKFFATATLQNGAVISVVTLGPKASTPCSDGTSADGSSESPAG